MQKRTIYGMALGLALVLAPRVAPAAPTTYYFYDFSSSTQGSNIDASGQMSVDVDDVLGQVLFRFKNAGPIDATIDDIYFDDTTNVIKNMSIVDTPPSVDFGSPAFPGDMPQANALNALLDPDFKADDPEDHSAGRTGGGASRGIGPSESLDLLFDYNGGNLTTVLNALNNRDLRLGMHVQSIDGTVSPYSDSDAYVNSVPPATPEPGSMALLGTGILGMIGRLRRRRSAKA